MTEWTIAEASVADAPEVAAIYAHHVLHGSASWEVTPPSPGEISDRMARVLGAGWPWLIARCEALGFRQMVAGMAGSEPGSMALHARAGFVEVARLPSVGRKFGKWLDLIYMQRALGDADTNAPEGEPA